MWCSIVISGFNTGLSPSKVPAGIASSIFKWGHWNYKPISAPVICSIPFFGCSHLAACSAAAGWTAKIPAPQVPGHLRGFWASSWCTSFHFTAWQFKSVPIISVPVNYGCWAVARQVAVGTNGRDRMGCWGQKPLQTPLLKIPVGCF